MRLFILLMLIFGDGFLDECLSITLDTALFFSESSFLYWNLSFSWN